VGADRPPEIPALVVYLRLGDVAECKRDFRKILHSNDAAFAHDDLIKVAAVDEFDGDDLIAESSFSLLLQGAFSLIKTYQALTKFERGISLITT
jgi:hypothetical protein